MTVMPSIGRAFAASFISRATSQLSSSQSLRVASTQSALVTRQHPFSQVAASYQAFLSKRTYATETGTASKTKSKSTARKTTTKKPAKKTATKTAKPKSKSKSKRKAKAKPKNKELTEAQKERAVRRSANKAVKDARAKTKLLKETALIGKEPKGLPRTAWSVITSEATKGRSGPVVEGVRAARQKYQNLSLSEREHYNHIANQNKQETALAYQKWLQSHTPLQIREANRARVHLNLLRRKETPKARKTYRLIQDDRLVRQPLNQYSLYTQARNASGDLNGMTIAERAKLISSEWKSLRESDKKTYQDRAAQARARYNTEYKSVYGIDPPASKK